AALAKLASDRQILTSDSADLKTTLANDRIKWAAIEKTDQSGITAVRKQTTAALTADKNKITADLKSSAATLADDLKTIAADDVRLAKDELLLQLSNLY